MARTDITSTKLVRGGDIAAVAATTIDATLVTNGVRIICKKPSKVFCRITNTHTSTHVVKGKGAAGAQDSADYSTTAIPITSGERLYQPAADRVQSDGCIYLDLDTGHTGALQVYELP